MSRILPEGFSEFSCFFWGGSLCSADVTPVRSGPVRSGGPVPVGPVPVGPVPVGPVPVGLVLVGPVPVGPVLVGPVPVSIKNRCFNQQINFSTKTKQIFIKFRCCNLV